MTSLTSSSGTFCLIRKVQSNRRLKDTDRFVIPPPPEEEMLASQALGSTPLLARTKQEGYGVIASEPRKTVELPRHQSLNHTSFLNDPKRTNNREIKNIADRLGFTLNSKLNSSYEMFKFFDKDNDG